MFRFGEFILKLGCVSFYFFNVGLFNDGEVLLLLVFGYVVKLIECNNVEVVFGFVYKGIFFVVVIVVVLL